jgi:outer membrane biosynthesis protein TonB
VLQNVTAGRKWRLTEIGSIGMASSKKKKTSKKPVAKKKVAAKKKPAAKKTKVAAKKKTAPKKKPAPKKTTAAKKKKPAEPTHGDAWGNAALAPKVAAKSPKASNLEPSGTPALALHDHEGGLVSPVADDEEVAERIHGGEEAVKDEDADDDSGSARLDDREDEES